MRYLWAFLVLFVAGSLFVACYAPKFGSPGYYCDPDENPPCPEGQSCVNGRCVNQRGGNNNNDDEDLASNDDPKDLKGADFKGVDMKKAPDLNKPGSTAGNTCGGYVECANACSSDTCISACQADLDLDGQTKFQDVVSCIYDYCEFTAADCEYDVFNDTYVDAAGAPFGACDDCINNAAADVTMQPCVPTNDPDCKPTACKSVIQACFNDT